MFKYVAVCIIFVPSIVLGSVEISFDPKKVPLAESVDIICTLSGSTSAAVTWDFASITTSCSGSACAPDPSPHTYSINGNVFRLTLPSAEIVNCVSYTCKDALNIADTTSKNLEVAYFDNSTITALEPGANMSGSINITTDCVFAPTDLTIKWYKVEGGDEIEIEADTSNERSTCTRMCGSIEDKIVTSRFAHQEYDGSNSVEVEYKVIVSHSSYSQQFVWTSAKHHLKGDCVCDCECKCEILVIVCAVFDGLGIIGLICDIVATLKKLLKSKVGLVLFGIAVFVLFIISIGLGAAALGNDDCDPDCCCPDEDCCCSDWVGNGALAFVVISSLGAVCAAFISFLICVNAIGPGKKEEGGPDGPDGGHNGGGALMTHARVHAGHEETHRGSLSNRPMPAIPTHQGQDKKVRGLSANFDDDHPMVSISVPEKKAGDLGPLHEEPQKKKKKKKKRTDEE